MSEKRPDPPEYRPVIRAELVRQLKIAAAEAEIPAAEFVNRAVQRAIVERADLKEKP